MKHLAHYFGAIGLILLIISCQKSNLTDIQIHDKSSLKENKASSETKISAEIMDLTESDAVIVAKAFSKLPVSTRANNNLSVEEVITVNDTAGNPAFYAVNYTDGYVLVSATKKTYPILAEVEHGKFSSNSGTGQDILVNEYVQAVEDAKADTNLTSPKVQWMPYEQNKRLEGVKTKIANDDYYDLLETYLEGWYNEGCNVYYMKKKPENMPDDLYELFCTIAHDDVGDVPGYPYMDCCIITEKPSEYTYQHGKLLSTHWNQISPYNSLFSDNRPLGCVTIATGQIMRYHEYPSSFNWEDMPNSTSNSTLSTFLKELHDDLKVNINGSATISDAMRVLKKYKYNYKKIAHSDSNVISSIDAHNPVFMSGIDKKTNEGHAWVCDKYTYSRSQTEYKMYELIFYNGKPFMLDEFAKEIIYDNNYFISYHMNWGWGGISDGYYYGVNVKANGETYSFSSNREDLIISK